MSVLVGIEVAPQVAQVDVHLAHGLVPERRVLLDRLANDAFKLWRHAVVEPRNRGAVRRELSCR